MIDKKYLLIGGAGLVGIGALWLLTRGGSQSVAAQPTNTGSPDASAATYPSAGITTAPINIQQAPLNITYNQPVDRNPPTPTEKKRDGCGCPAGITDQLPYISAAVVQAMHDNTASARSGSKFQSNPSPNNIRVQYPPDQFPWLYSAGHA